MFGEVEILITGNGNLIFTALFENEELEDFKVESRNKKNLVGSIFKGVIKRVCRGLDGYFVDIGLENEAYLQERGLCKGLKEGDSVIVQLLREEEIMKKGKLTCAVSLPGKYVVYFPRNKKLNVSSRIKNFPITKKLLEALKENLDDEEGVILRTSAIKSDVETVVKELKELKKLWKNIEDKAKKVKKGLIYEEIPLFARVIRDNWGKIKKIVVDNPDVWSELVEIFGEEIRDKIRYVRNIEDLFGDFSLSQILNKLLSKYVWLKDGGYIVIEETEAFVSIDVNSGESCGESLEETAFKTNLEAIKEIAKQIKLRNLGGMIIVDLIDMKDKKNKEKLIQEAKKIFREKGLNIKVYGITSLGLLEMTRKREGKSLLKTISELCPSCNGSGHIKSKEFIIFLIQKELEKAIGKKVEIRVHPHVYDTVLNFIKRKKLESWVSIKKVCSEREDFIEILYLDY